MKRIFVPTSGLGDWRSRLADPDIQWERLASAFETAVSWEVAAKTPRGLPATVASLLDSQTELRGAQLVVAVPEHKVPLPGGNRPSQSDVWALLITDRGLVSMAVEGKAAEPFGETLGEWLNQASSGKKDRLQFLMQKLGLRSEPPPSIRYQLLHRTASAVIEAATCRASSAVMMVQSFRRDPKNEADFVEFSELLGRRVRAGEMKRATSVGGCDIYLGWAQCEPATDAEVAQAAV